MMESFTLSFLAVSCEAHWQDSAHLSYSCCRMQATASLSIRHGKQAHQGRGLDDDLTHAQLLAVSRKAH